MAKKHRVDRGRSPAQPSARRDQAAHLLLEAIRFLRRNEYERADHVATRARKIASDAERVVAQQILAEIQFRKAMTGPPQERLHGLELALELTPDDPRLHFYRAVELCRTGRWSEALAGFEFVAAREPQRKGLAYLHALARLASGQPWEERGLSLAEANTLRLTARLISDAPPAPAEVDNGPWLGKSREMWTALAALRHDPTASPLEDLQTACRRDARRSIQRYLQYARGIAALRRGDTEIAQDAWLQAASGDLHTAGFTKNLAAFFHNQTIALAEAERWQELVELGGRLEGLLFDEATWALIGEAGFHCGYAAAQAGRWTEAVRYWREANELLPSRALAQNLALAEEAMGNWQEAASAWRDMVRRRPRSANHPDALSDAQVAAIWAHIADCYERAGDAEEAANALRAALKYAPKDAALRAKLASTLMDSGRVGSATSALEKTLEIDPRNVDALMRLAHLYAESWRSNPIPLWRRVLEIQPDHAEARDALADYYIETLGAGPPGWGSALARSPAERLRLLQEALKYAPDHPRLLLHIGMVEQMRGKETEAAAALRRACALASKDPDICGAALHSALHLRDQTVAHEIFTLLTRIETLLPAFWLNQIDSLLECKLDRSWVDRFLEAADSLIGRPGATFSHPAFLAQTYEILRTHEANDLAERVVERVRTQFPASGAVEYLEAFRLLYEQSDRKQVMDFLRRAERAARKARDEELELMVSLLRQIVDARLPMGQEPWPREGLPLLERLVKTLLGEGFPNRSVR